MLDLIGSLKGFLKINEICVDNNIFKLHYKLTVIVLLASSIIVTQKQYFGDPIDCITSTVDSSVMDTYCWIHSTYTYVEDVEKAKLDDQRYKKYHRNDVAPKGLGTRREGYKYKDMRYHSYYQWVTFFLYFQAVLFYLPRYLWKVWEGGKIKMLVSEMNKPIFDEEEKKNRKNLLVNYFTFNINRHEFYAYKFFLCEILNFINVIGQIYFTDRFLGYEFTSYGRDVMSITQEDWLTRRDPMSFLFPRVSSCDFFYPGSSGTMQKTNGLCLLPLNMFNEKIFVFLWFWYIIVATLSGLGLIYRALTLIPSARRILLKSRSKLSCDSDIDAISKRCQVGDFFLLYQLAKNMDPLIFKLFFKELSLSLQGKREDY